MGTAACGWFASRRLCCCGEPSLHGRHIGNIAFALPSRH
jgi:hypothetical protein